MIAGRVTTQVVVQFTTFMTSADYIPVDEGTLGDLPQAVPRRQIPAQHAPRHRPPG
jgi:hypothetical protein